MRILFFSARAYEQPFILSANNKRHALSFIDTRLSLETAGLANGFDAISVFTSDEVSAAVLEKLAELNVKYIAVRATGYDNVDITKAETKNIRVANVPAYSPQSIAEHAVAMMLVLSRNIVQSDQQVHQHNFKMDNLVGFTLHGKTVGIIGTGKIGAATIKILGGFGCRLLATDINPDQQLISDNRVTYTTVDELCAQSDIITIHAPLNQQTKYLINDALIGKMKKGVMLVNTSRGAIVHTAELIPHIESGQIGYLGMDVYENEKGIFFHDLSTKGLEDQLLKKLMSFPNVLITPHQAFATHEALQSIADTVFDNISEWASSGRCRNDLHV
jgi:D-lactate dehydrogenase